MAQTTGISWTDATVNFVIGCTRVGPGCDHCYAAAFSFQKWGIVYETGGERRETKSGFSDPLRWQRKHDAGRLERVKENGQVEKTPVWVFACSLSDFFDNEWPDGLRDRAWKVIKDTPSLRWQIVTKRVGNVVKMLPADWGDGSAYRHVGIVVTVVNQEEADRDIQKLIDLKARYAVKWIGLSIEPQLGPIDLFKWIDPLVVRPALLDWIIVGGESKQPDQPAREFDLLWAASLISQCNAAQVPVFIKQFGDKPTFDGEAYSAKKFGPAGEDVSRWPGHLRVQQMPTIYDADPPRRLV